MTTMHATIRMLRRGTDATSRHICPLRCESPRPGCRCLSAQLANHDPEDHMTDTTAKTPEPLRALDGDLSGITPPRPRGAPCPPRRATLDRIVVGIIFAAATLGLVLAVAMKIGAVTP